MRNLLVAIALTATGASYASGMFECKVLDGVVKIPGKTKVESVLNKDPKIVGEVFSVRPRTAEIKGSLLYQTEGHKVEVLRSAADEFSVLIRDSGGPGEDDISVFTLDRFEGVWSFKHYNSWHGLMTSGTCKES